mmetsp:Transcript_18652/g.17746  ORF Transcript_18652/g.17746 Transcript_18652/m.17746 type:complete len:84 (+) Transcript_18652:80-331(+)
MKESAIYREPKKQDPPSQGPPMQFENKYADYPRSKKELLDVFSNWNPSHVWDFRSIYKVFIDDSLVPSGERCFVYSVEKKLST